MWSLPSPRTPQGALSGSYASYEARRAECVWREVEVPQILRSLRAIAGKPQNVFSTPEVVVHGSRAHTSRSPKSSCPSALDRRGSKASAAIAPTITLTDID